MKQFESCRRTRSVTSCDPNKHPSITSCGPCLSRSSGLASSPRKKSIAVEGFSFFLFVVNVNNNLVISSSSVILFSLMCFPQDTRV